MNPGFAIFKKRQRFQDGTPMVSNQAQNVAQMSPQERLFYDYTQEMFKKRELEAQLREKGLEDEQGREEEVQQHAQGTSNIMQTTANNPGMRLFMAHQKLKRPQPFAKGESGVLSTKQRKAMPKSSFAIPSKAPGSGSYPINDPSHARNALSRVSQFGSPAEKAAVRAKVSSKYPNIGRK